MAIELHHLNTHGLMAQAGKVPDGVVRLKERIAELEKEIAELKEERRWRKFSEEKPRIYNEGDYFLVVVETETTGKKKGCYVSTAELFSDVWYYENGNEVDEYHEYELDDGTKGFYRAEVTHWMPMPSAPKEGK